MRLYYDQVVYNICIFVVVASQYVCKLICENLKKMVLKVDQRYYNLFELEKRLKYQVVKV